MYRTKTRVKHEMMIIRWTIKEEDTRKLRNRKDMDELSKCRLYYSCHRAVNKVIQWPYVSYILQEHLYWGP